MYIEDKVNELYQELENNNIPFEIESISAHFNILVAYNDDVNLFVIYKGVSIIYLKKADKRTMWEEFTHELAHYAMHDSDQRFMNEMYNEKQENEANKFSLLFQMPQNVIEREELYTQDKVMQFFNVNYDKALQRLQMLCDYYSNSSGVIHGNI